MYRLYDYVGLVTTGKSLQFILEYIFNTGEEDHLLIEELDSNSDVIFAWIIRKK